MIYEVKNMDAFNDLVSGKITKKQFIKLQNLNYVQNTTLPQNPVKIINTN